MEKKISNLEVNKDVKSNIKMLCLVRTRYRIKKVTVKILVNKKMKSNLKNYLNIYLKSVYIVNNEFFILETLIC